MEPTDRIGDDVTLYRGDCLTVLSDLATESVDVLITDPPYGIIGKFGEIATRMGYGDGRAKGTRKLQFDWDGEGVVDSVVAGLSLAFSLLKSTASCFVFTGFDHSEKFAKPAREAGFTVKPAAWVKQCPPPAGHGNWWPSGFELAYYGYRNSPFFGDDNPDRVNVFHSDSYRHGQPGKVNHPTQKPLALTRRIARALVPPGGVVLDCFMGSGTIGLAVLQLGEGRKFIGIEIDPEYYALAHKRLLHATGSAPGQLFALGV